MGRDHRRQLHQAPRSADPPDGSRPLPPGPRHRDQPHLWTQVTSADRPGRERPRPAWSPPGLRHRRPSRVATALAEITTTTTKVGRPGRPSHVRVWPPAKTEPSSRRRRADRLILDADGVGSPRRPPQGAPPAWFALTPSSSACPTRWSSAGLARRHEDRTTAAPAAPCRRRRSDQAQLTGAPLEAAVTELAAAVPVLINAWYGTVGFRPVGPRFAGRGRCRVIGIGSRRSRHGPTRG